MTLVRVHNALLSGAVNERVVWLVAGGRGSRGSCVLTLPATTCGHKLSDTQEDF